MFEMTFRFMLKNWFLFISCAFTLKLKKILSFSESEKKQHSITKVYAFVSPFPKAQIFCNIEKWM